MTDILHRLEYIHNLQYAIIGPDNVLEPDRRQVIIWIIYGIIYWCT